MARVYRLYNVGKIPRDELTGRLFALRQILEAKKTELDYEGQFGGDEDKRPVWVGINIFGPSDPTHPAFKQKRISGRGK